jgi:hypothetical protein
VSISPKHYITQSPFLMSIQIGWEPQIYNTDLPYWHRVWAVAMARSQPNMHTPLQPGELAKLLGKPQSDGTIKSVDRRDLHRYVKQAVEMKLLDETSCVRCLVLPETTTACRLPGFRSPCGYHTGKSSKIKRPIAIKQQDRNSAVFRANTDDASSQVTESAVGQITRHCRVNNPTPGSRDIFAVMPRTAEEVVPA